MFDPAAVCLFLFQFAALFGLGCWIAKRADLPWRLWPLAAFLLVWSDLVFTAHLTSLFAQLDNLLLYVPLSFGVMIGLYGVVQQGSGSTAPLCPPSAPVSLTPLSPAWRRFLWIALGSSFAIVFLLSLIITLGAYPDNADSIIYRLPRVFWYVSHHSFLHPFESLDKRLVFYPLDGVALYIPVLLYALPATFYNLPSMVMWLAAVYTAYRFAREIGGDRLLSFFAAWLVALTPNILVQAVSTNDEILAAAALFVGLYLGFVWLRTGNRAGLLFAAAGVGLSAGTKMHIVFLAPIFLAVLAWLVWRGLQKPERFAAVGHAIGWRAGLGSLIWGALLFFPFFLYNYASTGNFYFLQQSATEVLNLKGNLQAVFQNLVIYVSQMMLAPVADLNILPDVEDRQAFNTWLNNFTGPFIRPLISQDPSLYHAFYRFQGVTLPTSVRFVEFSLWAGFVWMLWPLQIAAIRRSATETKKLFLLFALTPLLWLLLWCATTLYMEGTATYFSYYLLLAAPAAVFVFAPLGSALKNRLRWILIGFVALTSLVIDGNVFAYSGFRSLPGIIGSRTWPFDWLLFAPGVIREIQLAQKIRIICVHEKMPYFGFMHWNPQATYLDPFQPPSDPKPDELQIIPASSIASFGFMPVVIPGKATPGLTFIGLIRGIGHEAVFALGNNVERRHPTESNYILPILQGQRTAEGFALGFRPETLGYHAEDNLEFHLEIKKGEDLVYQRDWADSLAFLATLHDDPLKYRHLLRIQVRAAKTHKPLADQSYQVLGFSQWLPDRTE